MIHELVLYLCFVSRLSSPQKFNYFNQNLELFSLITNFSRLISSRNVGLYHKFIIEGLKSSEPRKWLGTRQGLEIIVEIVKGLVEQTHLGTPTKCPNLYLMFLHGPEENDMIKYFHYSLTWCKKKHKHLMQFGYDQVIYINGHT